MASLEKSGVILTAHNGHLSTLATFVNLVPRAFPLKVGKSPGNEVTLSSVHKAAIVEMLD